MRHTEIKAWEGNEPSQEKLDLFWQLIEDNPGLNWRVEYNGDVTLEVDETVLMVVLGENPLSAREFFGAWEEHSPEYEKYEWNNLPEDLLGTYTVKGIYDTRGYLESTNREYRFVQEGA